MICLNTMPAERLAAHRALTELPLSLCNARQLGGIVLRDGRRVKEGLLLRTSRLSDADERDLALLRERYGVSLILDMRGGAEIARAPDPAIEGAKWVQTDIIDFEFMRGRLAARGRAQGEELFAEPGEIDMDRMIEQMIVLTRRSLGREVDEGIGAAYAGYLESPLGREKLGLFFHELAAVERGAALWHCHTGKDRTGIAAGLILEVLGADWDTILTDYETSNLYYERDIAGFEAMLRRKGMEEALLAPVCGLVGVHRPMLENAWRYMEREWGGAIGYLTRACGVGADELDALRARYIE